MPPNEDIKILFVETFSTITTGLRHHIILFVRKRSSKDGRKTARGRSAHRTTDPRCLY